MPPIPPLNTMQLKVDWAWGLSFLVTLFTLFNGGVLLRAGPKIDECVRGSQGIGGSVVIRITLTLSSISYNSTLAAAAMQ